MQKISWNFKRHETKGGFRKVEYEINTYGVIIGDSQDRLRNTSYNLKIVPSEKTNRSYENGVWFRGEFRYH